MLPFSPRNAGKTSSLCVHIEVLYSIFLNVFCSEVVNVVIILHREGISVVKTPGYLKDFGTTQEMNHHLGVGVSDFACTSIFSNTVIVL